MKVFLSSTYNDLTDHRRAAHDALEQLGLQVIWMEAFGARPVDSTTACLNEVEESDLFVGIYAHRYAPIPSCRWSPASKFVRFSRCLNPRPASLSAIRPSERAWCASPTGRPTFHQTTPPRV